MKMDKKKNNKSFLLNSKMFVSVSWSYERLLDDKIYISMTRVS